MSEFLEVVSPSALKQLQEVNAELLKTIASVKDVNNNMISVKTPSGSDSAIKKLTADYDAQRATIQKLQQQLNALATTQQKVTSSSVGQRNATRENSVAQQILRAETDRQVRANTLLGGAYAKASAQLLILKKQAKDYAIALGEAHPKTLQAVKDANDLGGRIKSADNVVGDFQRNVGNYSNGLVNGFQKVFSSVRQLAYILPGIGIAGIFGLALDPLFSYISGLKIVQDTFGLETEAITKAKEALVEKSKIEDEARNKLASYQSDELSKSKLLLEDAQNLSLSMAQRTKAVTELQARYPDYLGNLSKEQILAGDTAVAEEKLNEALIKRGIALSSQQLIQEEINNSLKNEKWITDQLNDIQKKRVDLGKQISAIDPFTKNEDLKVKYEELSLQLSRLFYLEGTLKEQYKDKNNTIQESIKFYIAQYNANSKYLGAVVEETGKTKKATKAKEEKRDADISSLKALQDTISALKTEQQMIDRSSTTYEVLGGQIKLLETIYKGLTETMKEVQEGIALTDEEVFADVYAWYKLRDATNEYVKTLSSGYIEKSLDSIGLASLKMFTDFDIHGKSTFDNLLEGADTLQEKFAITFQAIGDVAQNVFNSIAETQQQNYDAQYARLEQERDVAILFAGESASARNEIQEQYEQKRKQIARREAKAKQQQAIFNIAIDTAQALVAQLAATPLPFGTGFLAIIAALGAAQIAMVASQQIPQYYKGTDNAEGGLAWTQEKGAEIITDKYGKIKSTGSDKGAQLTMLSKGDKVFTAEKSAMMFDQGLNSILTNNGISMPKIEINTDTKIIADKLDNLASTIANKESFKAVKDARGYRIYQRKQAEEKQLLNNVLTYKGFNV